MRADPTVTPKGTQTTDVIITSPAHGQLAHRCNGTRCGAHSVVVPSLPIDVDWTYRHERPRGLPNP